MLPRMLLVSRVLWDASRDSLEALIVHNNELVKTSENGSEIFTFINGRKKARPAE